MNLDGNVGGFAAGTVLFDNWKPIKRWTASGRRTWDIEFHFSIIQGIDGASTTLTWNHYYSRSASGFVQVSVDGTTATRMPYLTTSTSSPNNFPFSDGMNRLFSFSDS